MKNTLLELIISIFRQLTAEEKDNILKILNNELIFDWDTISEIIRNSQNISLENRPCVNCKSHNIIKYGKKKGKQRFRCKDCRSVFTDISETFINGIHSPYNYGIFILCFVQGMSLRDTADRTGMSYVSMFYWRHKLLNSLKQYDVDKFEGVVEMDETFFLMSFKGKKYGLSRKPRKSGGKATKRGISREQVCVFVGRDRNQNILSKVACFGKMSFEVLEKIIDGKITSDNILCSDAWKPYKKFAQKHNIKHYEFDSSKQYTIDDIYHIQGVNAYHQRLKDWLRRFNGVSTKYLNNYLSYFKYIDLNKKNPKKIEELLRLASLPTNNSTYKSIRIGVA